MSLLKNVIRQLIIETIESRIEDEALIAVAEFVGANEKFNLNSIHSQIKPFIKNYKNLYRFWTQFESDTDIKLIQQEANNRDYMSATKNKDAIIPILEYSGFKPEEIAITSFDAIGFDPIEFIKVGIKQNPQHKEIDFLKSVLIDNEYQNEIIVLKIVGEMKKVNL